MKRMTIAATSQILSLIIQCATIITLIYTLIRFAGKPQADIKEWRKGIEEWKKEVDKRLNSGNDHFTQIDDGNKVTQKAILALIDHAIDQNHTDKLIEAKDDLQNYLVNK